MERALAVANELIQRGIDHNMPPTQMKLQKLMFFAHGWYLSLYDNPLLDQQFEAWPYGPVIPSVYYEFRHFGRRGIDTLGQYCFQVGKKKFQWIPIRAQDTNELPNFLDRIWEVFGIYSGGELSQMTHAPNSPWQKVREQYGDILNIQIPNEMIKEYFKELANNHV